MEKAEELAAKLQKLFPSLTLETAAPGDCGTLSRWFTRTNVLVQATSLGLKPGDPPPFDLELLTPPCTKTNLKLRAEAEKGACAGKFELAKRAKELGLPAAGGSAMLLYQGAKSFEIWTGLAAPIEEMRAGMEGKPSC